MIDFSYYLLEIVWFYGDFFFIPLLDLYFHCSQCKFLCYTIEIIFCIFMSDEVCPHHWLIPTFSGFHFLGCVNILTSEGEILDKIVLGSTVSPRYTCTKMIGLSCQGCRCPLRRAGIDGIFRDSKFYLCDL